MENGIQGTYGEGDTVIVKMSDATKTYRIKIECDIQAGSYDMYVDGVLARHLYFTTNTTDNKTANDTLHTGAYFGLYGGLNGRTQFSNIVISTKQAPEQGEGGEGGETPDNPNPDHPENPENPEQPEVNEVKYQIVGGEWEVTKDSNGNNVYTSTADNALLNFDGITLENNAVVEFDMTLLASGSSMVGMVFGLDSVTDTSGFCIGRASTDKPGCTWITDGTLNGYGSGDSTTFEMPFEANKTYHVKIVCDIQAGAYDMYIDGEFARHVYFKTSNKAGKESLHTGSYFGLYGGKSGGRTQFSINKIYVIT